MLHRIIHYVQGPNQVKKDSSYEQISINLIRSYWQASSEIFCWKTKPTHL